MINRKPSITTGGTLTGVDRATKRLTQVLSAQIVERSRSKAIMNLALPSADLNILPTG